MLNNYLSIDIRMVNDKLSSLASFGTLSSNEAGFFKKTFFVFVLIWFTFLLILMTIVKYNILRTEINEQCFQVNLISCEYDLWNKTRLSEIKISLEKNLTGIECIFFKVSFGNMTRDASFFKDYVDFRANRNDSSRRVYKNKFTATHCYL